LHKFKSFMDIFKKIEGRITSFYKKHIIYEQYPMLTSTNRKQWLSKGALGVVYMLHHIAEKCFNRIPTNEDLKVSPRFLESIIIKYKKQGFSFVSLDQISEIISQNQIPSSPFIAFTIDDGYLDNYINAFPIFIKHKIPFAIFISTDFVDKKAILWWDVIEDLILQNKEIIIGNKRYSCNSFQEKWDTFRVFREKIMQFNQDSFKESLQYMFCNYNIDWLKPIKEKGMTWDQIKELSHHPLCTIGGHTVSHPVLNKLDEATLRWEIEEGVNRIEKETGISVNHFAYPYGSSNEIGKREEQLIQSFNFKTVFAATGGCITRDNKHRITLLPRVFLKQ